MYAIAVTIAIALPCLAANDILCTPATSEAKPFVCTPLDAAAKARDRVAVLASNHWRDISLLTPGSDVSARTVGMRVAWQAAPAIATISITTANHAWTWNESRDDLANLRTLHLVPGRYKLSVKSEGFEDAAASIDVTTGNADLGTIRLSLQRVASGRVIDAATHSPLGGATITAKNAVVATADAEGKFSAVLAQDVKEITVSYPERADAAIAVAEGGARGLEVALSRAASLRVIVDRTTLPDRKLTVTLLEERDEGRWLNASERTLAAADMNVVFDHMRPGTYRLNVRGDTPLAFFSTDTFELVAGDRIERILRISPAHLSLFVTLGENALSAATIELTNSDYPMKGTLTLNDGGQAEAEVWQPGLFVAAVRSPLLRTPHVVHRRLGSDPEESWHLRIPDLRVGGRVVDAKTGRGIRDADVFLASKTSNGGTTVTQPTGQDGEFEFRGVVPGSQTLDVTAEGYLKHAPVEFPLGENENRNVDFKLQSGAQREVRVKAPSGAVIPNASVLTVVGGQVVSSVSADGAGVARVALPEGASALLIASAPRGSFGMIRLSSTNAADSAVPIDLIVPDGTATLRLTARTTDDQPVPGVGFVVRFDGEMLPADALAPAHLDALTTNRRGESTATLLPPGDYELWPFETREEAILVTAAPPPPTVRLQVRPGINETSLRFQPN
jgi:hypothetical protein